MSGMHLEASYHQQSIVQSITIGIVQLRPRIYIGHISKSVKLAHNARQSRPCLWKISYVQANSYIVHRRFSRIIAQYTRHHDGFLTHTKPALLWPQKTTPVSSLGLSWGWRQIEKCQQPDESCKAALQGVEPSPPSQTTHAVEVKYGVCKDTCQDICCLICSLSNNQRTQ